MPIPKAQAVNLLDAERNGLEKLIKRHQVEQQITLRARIVLAAARGLKNKEIAQTYRVTLDTVSLWRNRWVKLQNISFDDLSIEDRLQDAPRPGAPARITADQRCQIEALACKKLEEADRPREKPLTWKSLKCPGRHGWRASPDRVRNGNHLTGWGAMRHQSGTPIEVYGRENYRVCTLDFLCRTNSIALSQDK